MWLHRFLPYHAKPSSTRPKQLAIGVEKHALRIVGAWFVNDADMCGVAARVDVIVIGNDRQLARSAITEAGRGESSMFFGGTDNAAGLIIEKTKNARLHWIPGVRRRNLHNNAADAMDDADLIEPRAICHREMPFFDKLQIVGKITGRKAGCHEVGKWSMLAGSDGGDAALCTLAKVHSEISNDRQSLLFK